MYGQNGNNSMRSVTRNASLFSRGEENNGTGAYVPSLGTLNRATTQNNRPSQQQNLNFSPVRMYNNDLYGGAGNQNQPDDGDVLRNEPFQDLRGGGGGGGGMLRDPAFDSTSSQQRMQQQKALAQQKKAARVQGGLAQSTPLPRPGTAAALAMQPLGQPLQPMGSRGYGGAPPPQYGYSEYDRESRPSDSARGGYRPAPPPPQPYDEYDDGGGYQGHQQNPYPPRGPPPRGAPPGGFRDYREGPSEEDYLDSVPVTLRQGDSRYDRGERYDRPPAPHHMRADERQVAAAPPPPQYGGYPGGQGGETYDEDEAEADYMDPVSHQPPEGPSSAGSQGRGGAAGGAGGDAPRIVPPVSLSERRDFVTKPPPYNASVQCYILRSKKTGLFKLFLDDGDHFLLASKKRNAGINKSANYLVSVDEEDLNRDSQNFIGKVRSNYSGTEFTVFDNGINPEKKEAKGAALESLRMELGAITYETNFKGMKGPRKMTAVVPRIRGNRPGAPAAVFRPLTDKDGLLTLLEKGLRLDEMLILANKQPKWNEALQAYCLNFNGRVTQASVKNFQLVAEEDEDTVLLQFGKIGKDAFTMDYRYPLTAIQAFSICLSSLDRKLVCE